jgi:hypothetical protein
MPSACFRASLAAALLTVPSHHIFIHEKKWTEALHAFRESVFKSAEGTRTQRCELYDQIKTILLNPAAVVIKHSSGQLLGAGREVIDSNFTRYNLTPANPVLHHAHRALQTMMAPFSKGDWPADYNDRIKKIGLFFCPKAPGSPLAEQLGQVAQKFREQAQKNAAAAFSTKSNPSSSDDECSAAKAATATAPAPASTPAVDQHPISKFTSISSNDSSDLKLSSATSADNHLTVLTDITEVFSALHCAQGKLSSLQLISQDVPSIPQQNLLLFRCIVAEISDKLSKLTAFVTL